MGEPDERHARYLKDCTPAERAFLERQWSQAPARSSEDVAEMAQMQAVALRTIAARRGT